MIKRLYQKRIHRPMWVPEAPALTTRQTQIASLIAQGFSTKGGARFLGVSTKTYEFHRLRVYDALKIDNVVDLTHWAIRTGLVPLKR